MSRQKSLFQFESKARNNDPRSANSGKIGSVAFCDSLKKIKINKNIYFYLKAFL